MLGKPSLLAHCLHQVLPLNLERITSYLVPPILLLKALQNWKISVKAFEMITEILTIIAKQLIAIIIVNFKNNK
jgi:hypothetical protein